MQINTSIYIVVHYNSSNRNNGYFYLKIIILNNGQSAEHQPLIVIIFNFTLNMPAHRMIQHHLFCTRGFVLRMHPLQVSQFNILMCGWFDNLSFSLSFIICVYFPDAARPVASVHQRKFGWTTTFFFQFIILKNIFSNRQPSTQATISLSGYSNSWNETFLFLFFF